MVERLTQKRERAIQSIDYHIKNNELIKYHRVYYQDIIDNIIQKTAQKEGLNPKHLKQIYYGHIN